MLGIIGIRLARPPGGVEKARFNDHDGQFAYQGIAGLAVPIPGLPGLAITAEYRYFATLDARFRGRVVRWA